MPVLYCLLLVGALVDGPSSDRDRATYYKRLIRDTASFDKDTREEALRQLRLAGSAAVPTLTVLLRDPDTTVRCDAADALGIVGRGEVLAERALAEALHDDDSGVRMSAVSALAEWSDTEASVFIEPLEDPDRFVRATAAEALGSRISQKEAAAAALARHLDDQAWGVRYAVRHSLVALSVRSDSVRRELLEQVRCLQAEPWSVEHGDERADIYWAMGEMGVRAEDGAEARKALLAGLAEPRRCERIFAGQALIQLGWEKRAVEMVLRSATTGDPDGQCRAAAQLSLAELRKRRP